MIIIELAYSFHLGSDKSKKNSRSKASAKSNASGLTKVDYHNYRKYDNEQKDILIIRGTFFPVNDVKNYTLKNLKKIFL
ncbi:MAG: hypothetical protein Q4C44_03005 [bacterium]|nr:hypothetical protein [bacterium]